MMTIGDHAMLAARKNVGLRPRNRVGVIVKWDVKRKVLAEEAGSSSAGYSGLVTRK